MPETEDECRALKAWADAQTDRHTPATSQQIARHLEFLSVTMPRQATDIEGGRKRIAVYARLLDGYSNDAIAHMAVRACETLDWFPTPKQCLDLVREYDAPPTLKQRALGFCSAFTQRRMDQFIAALADGIATQDLVDSQPERWRMIAMERGYLRRLDDGSFVIRQRPALDAPECEP